MTPGVFERLAWVQFKTVPIAPKEEIHPNCSRKIDDMWVSG
jgi:hypothetical protein